jgi:hypothetical protein
MSAGITIVLETFGKAQVKVKALEKRAVTSVLSLKLTHSMTRRMLCVTVPAFCPVLLST